jgi:sugar lactone lactonase YvrE
MKVVMRAFGALGLVGVALLACNAIISVPDPGANPADATSPDAMAVGDGPIGDDAIDEDAATPGPEAGSDASTCNGIPVTLSSDPKNCGSCGHDCLGGGCQNGSCQPITLVLNAAGAIGVAVDDTNVYFTQYNDGCVSKVPKTGGAVELMSYGRGNPWLILTEGGNVYWTDRSGAIYSAAASSGVPGLQAMDGGSVGQCGLLDAGVVLGDVDTLAIVPPAAEPYGIATDGVNLYWTNLEGGGGVWTVPIAGSHPSDPQLVSVGPCGAYCQTGIAVSGSDLLWMSYAGYVYRTPAGAHSASQLTRLINVDARFVASDGTNVYWTMSDSNSVWTVPLAGGETVAISEVEATPWGIVVDSSGVYWVDSGALGPVTSAVRRARFQNGSWSIVTLADGLGVPMGVATDSTAIYWVENGSGNVMKLAK